MIDEQQIAKIEELCNMLDNKSIRSEDIKNFNLILTDFASIKNFSSLKFLLYNTQSPKAKFYASSSLQNLITQNFLSVEINDKIEMYEYLLNYMLNNSETLFLNLRYLLNNLITLMCKIVRVSWFQSSRFKEVVIIDICKFMRHDFSPISLIPIMIQTELVYQFQLADIPPKHSLFKFTSDFKEHYLFSIYEFACNSLVSTFNNKYNFENLECYVFFIKEISNCLNECLEYEEDLNVKSENYKKFEIKPVYVPNCKKRCKDKSLDINSLNTICLGLFESHLIISKIVKEGNYKFEKWDFCLNLLQKFSSMKLIYLGDSKMNFLKILQYQISQLIILKQGFNFDDNLEEFCKLIFVLKKNFTAVELLDDFNFIDVIFNFTKECIEYYPDSTAGLIYLLRFFGYFSHILYSHPIPNKSEIKRLIFELLSSLLKKIFSFIESNSDHDEIFDSENEILLNDLVDAIAIISRGILVEANTLFYKSFTDLFEIIQNTSDSNNLPRLITKLNFLVYCSTASIAYNQRILHDKIFEEKVLDKEETLKEMSVIEEDSKKECEIVSYILYQNFKVLDFYMKGIKNLNLSNLKIGIFYFLKSFCKLFLSRNLSAKYDDLFINLNQILGLNENSLILSFILKFLIDVCKQNGITDHKTTHMTIKIFNTIVENMYITYDVNTGDKLLQVGKLKLDTNFLNSLIDIHNIVVNIHPITSGKNRTLFYESISKIILLKENSTNYEFFNTILDYYIENINIRKELLNNEENGLILIGYIKDLIGITSSITSKGDYYYFITKIFNSLLSLKNFYSNNCNVHQVNISWLKLLSNITLNKVDRVSFKMNSSLPIQILNLAVDTMQSYKTYLRSLSPELKDDYNIHIKPVIEIVKIFKNIIQGKYIQIGSLISMNKEFITDIFYTINELIFSVKLENLLSYEAKSNIIFSFLKIIYCDYIDYLDFQRIVDYIPSVIKLLEEGLECLDNVSLILSHQIIFEWGKVFIKYRTFELTPQSDGYSAFNFVKFIFSKYEEKFQNILTKLLDKIFKGEITSLSDMSNSLFVLVSIYETYYFNILNNLILVYFKDSKSKSALELSGELFKDINMSLDNRNLDKFKVKIKWFSTELQKLHEEKI